MMNRLEAAARQALEALEVATTPFARDRQEVLRAQAALREALAEQASALAKQQAFVDSLPAGDDKMFEQIHLWAMQSYKRHRGSTAGQQITAADSFDTHIIWAALRWAGEHQAPTQQALTREDKRYAPGYVMVPNAIAWGIVGSFGHARKRNVDALRELLEETRFITGNAP